MKVTEQELLSATAEIVKGIVSNPNIEINTTTLTDGTTHVLYKLKNGSLVNTASIVSSVLTGIKMGID
jgi:hypothetical protein